MTAWRRWQDYATIVLGALLFVSPVVFGDTGQSVAAATAYVLGVLLVVAGIIAEAMNRRNGFEIVPAVLGVVAFVSPWVFGFTAVTGVAWVAWIVGALAIINAGYLLLSSTARPRVA